MMSRLLTLTAVLAASLAMLLPLPAADDKKDEGFKSIMPDKDLKGWKTHEGDKARWKVQDGVLVGEGPVGHLYTERDDYENFIWRCEAKISDKGNSGMMFRCKFTKGFPPGYEAQINATHGDKIRTGSLYPAGWAKYLTDEQKKKILIFDCPHKPDEWFTQEVIADGGHIIIKVNGKTTVDFVDEKNSFTKGHLAIQQHNDGSVISVRKMEIKELPSKK
jgi:hypothetical protein